MLIERVEGILDRGGFEYCETGGCFEIAAKRDFTLFIKVLDNVDSICENHATSLKIVSKGFDAAVALVGTHTRRESLADNIIYERFEIPTMTPSTLESIVVNDSFPLLYRQRGGLFVDIDPQKLRARRESAGLSQRELADRVGINKKSVYEHERQKKKALLPVAKKIEKIIGNVSERAALKIAYRVTGVPSGPFEKQVSDDLRQKGFVTDAVRYTPFNILAKNSEIALFSEASENRKLMEKQSACLAEISGVTKVGAIAVTSEQMSLRIPTVVESELKEMSVRQLKKLLK